jgi:hypothetical protein
MLETPHSPKKPIGLGHKMLATISMTAKPAFQPMRRADAAELRRIFEARVRQRFGIRGDEFVARFDRGDYDGMENDGDLVEIEMMMPPERPYKSCPE